MNTFTCSICFESYSQERKPMIICQEGHSICEKCLKNMNKCPFCRTSFDNFKPIPNRDLLRAAEDAQKNSKIKNSPIIPLYELDIEKEPFAFGGSADIFKAKWGNKQVVVKKMRFQSNEKQKEQFQNELNLAVTLNHSNIIRIYGIVEFSNQFGIVMEFAEQGNLAQKIPNLTYGEQINFSLRIIEAIRYLHKNLIIHRDLKPENILISNNEPKITDFGISKIHEHTIEVTTAIVSYRYSAPELFQQGNTYDTSCDIFSLSMILYAIFSKKEPFDKENTIMIPMKIIQGERPEFPNDFPKYLAEVIQKGWNENSKKRSSLNEFSQCLDRMNFERNSEIKTKKEEMKKLFPQFSDSEIIQDIEYIYKLKEWINDNYFFSKMKKGYSIKQNGSSSQNWHSAVDGKGKTLVIIKTKDNFIFGGFTQVGFNANIGYISDPNAFIFSLRNDKNNRKPEKFTIQEGEDKYALLSNLNNGPIFGFGYKKADFCLYSDFYQHGGYSNFGFKYNMPDGMKWESNESQSYLAGSYKSWAVDELETYFIENQFSDSEIIQDIEYIYKLKEWINDNYFFSKMKKGYSIKQNGSSSQNWHSAVDGKGKTLVIIKTKDNFIFGGFTQVGFNANIGYISDPNAFIFSLRNDKNNRKPEKFTIQEGEDKYALLSNLNNGPIFGFGYKKADFCLYSDFYQHGGYSNFGFKYNMPDGMKWESNESQSYLAGSYKSWAVDELETYFIENQFSDSEIIQDIEYIYKLKEWINDNYFFSKMKKGYSAKQDGFNSQNWHSAVDGKGKTLVIIKTKDNFIFGGFTQVGFNANIGYISDPNAFIFSLRNYKNNRKPEKFPIKKGNEKNAIYSNLNNGPIFGPWDGGVFGPAGTDLYFSELLSGGSSDLGYSYDFGGPNANHHSKSYLAGSPDEWVVDELETYFIENQFSDSEIIQDIEYIYKLKEWINDNYFFSKMKKGYSIKQNGSSSQNWHSAVDGKGKTLVIIKTKDNFIFGGFTQVGFKYSPDGEYISDPNAFIFSLRNDKNNRKPEKFTIQEGEDKYALLSNLNNGPIFGFGYKKADFCLYSDFYQHGGYSNFGFKYNMPDGMKWESNESQSYLAGSYKSWAVDELETYFIENQFSDSEIIQDIEYIYKLKEWINDNDFFSKMKKGYSIKQNGSSSQNWHSAVDGKGKTLVIIKNKKIILFLEDLLKNDKNNRKPEKFTIQEGEDNYALLSNLNNGPIFGFGYKKADFCLYSDFYQHGGYSNFGFKYNMPDGMKWESNESQSYLAGSYKSWAVDELETYFI
ncbi:hypothetical protein M0811_02672 [Anaeramoeba ignava]|uniref:Non-specific serine/threonine protein kinase n=1 Tax=Anaeramoeba ignava TaxID=1746090 RepID=A0A9Q0R7H0_ANAIG|nr:hypothetical protein M0811_02672 [Anaeramoeba ignava]